MTRLDGYTESDAEGLVDHALAAQSAPYNVLLDVDAARGISSNPQPFDLLYPGGQVNPYYNLNYDDYNADLVNAAAILAGRPLVSTVLDSSGGFWGSAVPLMIYVSWGSNDSQYNADTYHSLTFAPGGIAETAVSTSGRTFLPTSGGQSLIADLITQGVSGAKGYVSEPYLDAIASPTVLCDFYISGETLPSLSTPLPAS